ncbi:MAG: MFS transporter [Desulfuromonadales bacterium]|nr:MFS transporter [Desulfuromonadales bacterium]
MKILPKDKARFGWCMYDWANSAFATVILGAVLPVYFASLIPESGVAVFWSDKPVPATAFWGYIVSFSMALVALSAPGLGNLADRRNLRRPLLIGFCLLGSLSTASLFFADQNQYLLAAGLFVLGNIGFASGNIFYNSYLPTLASGHEADKLSARGFAFGYIGGGLTLLLVFLLIQFHQQLGLPDKAIATRIGFVITGVWWLGFALPSFVWLRDVKTSATTQSRLRSPRDYLKALAELKQYPDLARFLLAFLLYNDGIQTIIAVSAIFARQELGLGTGTILGCFLMIQFVAMPGALLFSRLAGRFGAKKAILLSLVIFTAIAGYASIMHSALEFWLLGFTVAIVLGGSQAISRSLFSGLIPQDRSAEFFGFYAISSKFASIFGPLTFALLIDLTGSNRIAILALALFFVLGMLLLRGVDVERGRALAEQA